MKKGQNGISQGLDLAILDLAYLPLYINVLEKVH